MSKVYIGVDPGQGGAIAFLNAGRPEVHDFSEWTWNEIIRNLCAYAEAMVCIEHAQAMPKQGSVSMFHYGEHYGTWKGLFLAQEIPFQEVRPQTWKKDFGLIGTDKARSIEVAIQLFPTLAGRLNRKKDHGRAEALLIGEWGRRKNL